MTSRTNTALFLATEWHIIIQDIVLIDPDLNKIGEYHQNGCEVCLTVPASRADDTR